MTFSIDVCNEFRWLYTIDMLNAYSTYNWRYFITLLFAIWCLNCFLGHFSTMHFALNHFLDQMWERERVRETIIKLTYPQLSRGFAASNSTKLNFLLIFFFANKWNTFILNQSGNKYQQQLQTYTTRIKYLNIFNTFTSVKCPMHRFHLVNFYSPPQ